MNSSGILYLIPTTLGNDNTDRVIPQYNYAIINSLDEFIVEELRSARRFLRKANFDKDFDRVVFHILNEHTKFEESINYLDSLKKGKNVGLLSEAGVPCIADPGAEIVKRAHKNNIRVIPLTGPSSIILSLMASGFNGQNFAFVGYLPIKENERIKKIKELEKLSFTKKQTQIFIETPYRNTQVFNSLTQVCSDKTQVCIACNLTLENEYIATKSIFEWRKLKPDIHKKPAVFLLSV
ncbi:MAG: SAM-dependent methyltransferase [Bacteroidales bacterium]|nr:SAM-dependent methyltransferase [Bacteroidales bacterium]